MLAPWVFFVFLFVFRSASQHVHFTPAPVASAVSSAKVEFADYISNGADDQRNRIRAAQATPAAAAAAASCAPYWFEQIKHQGKASFNSNSTYQVWRNVKDFGAKGDGLTDDTAAINAAISSSKRCAPGVCASSTTTPATVYFPAGTYIVSSSIIDYYYTNLIGNPNCLPVLKPTARFTGLGVIDGNQYQAGNKLGFGSTNVFFRQVRNFIIDMTGVPASTAMTGIHWPTAQATSIQNVQFKMSSATGTQHQGLFIEEGSGGYVGDLRFDGGLYGLNVGNQQFTMRNITITNAVTAIYQIWSWGWTYSGITVSNCQVGLNMSHGFEAAQQVVSVTLLDSSFTNVPVGIITAHSTSSLPHSSGSLVMENVKFSNVPIIVKEYTDRTVLTGSTGTTTIAAWGEGYYYIPNEPTYFERSLGANSRPSALVTSTGAYYARSKPQYEGLSTSSFLSVRGAGAKGDGVTDDTKALQAAINSAKSSGKVLFFDAGYYKVTSTLYVPAGSRITGESYPVIMSSGSFFSNIKSPKAVVQIGKVGETGVVEWSDMIVSTQGAQAGASLIQWNLNSPSATPSGMWDVHVRVGGFTGSQLQVAQCPTTPNTATPPAIPNAKCISDFLSMHVTSGASGIYMENCWIWVADHDIDDPSLTQITVYSGRGLLVDSKTANMWLVGTSVEHHSLYEYQFVNTQNVFMGQIQTETAYYQPNPDALTPFVAFSGLNDPTFTRSSSSNTAEGWGLRIVNGTNIYTYGAGLYSFFDNYSTGKSEVREEHYVKLTESFRLFSKPT